MLTGPTAAGSRSAPGPTQLLVLLLLNNSIVMSIVTMCINVIIMQLYNCTICTMCFARAVAPEMTSARSTITCCIRGAKGVPMKGV